MKYITIIRNSVADFFAGIGRGVRWLFVERLGWQGTLACVLVAILLALLTRH